MNTLCGVELVVTVERRSTWAGKPSAAGAVNYLASVGTILLYNTIAHSLQCPRTVTLCDSGAHYYTALRTDLLPARQMVPAPPMTPLLPTPSHYSPPVNP